MLKKLYIGESRETLPILSILLGLSVMAVYQWESPFYTPLIGLLLVLVGVMASILIRGRSLSLGKWYIWVPLLIVVVSAIGSRGVYEGIRWELNLAYMAFLAFMFLLFLCGRLYGNKFVGVFALAGALFSLGIIVQVSTGSYESINGLSGFALNTNVVACFMGMSLFFCKGKLKWLIPLILVGIVLAGAHGTIAGLLVVLGYFGVTRGYRFLTSRWDVPQITHAVGLSALVLVVLVPVLLVTGTFGDIYEWGRVTAYVDKEATFNEATAQRWDRWVEAVDKASFTGYGLPVAQFPDGTPFEGHAVHNAPLEIMDEIGVVAAICWTWVLLYMVVRCRKYRPVFILIAVVSLVSNFTWWPFILGPLVWYLFGLGSRDAEVVVSA